MYPIIRCYTCNKSIGEYYNAYILMKNYLYEQELKKKLSDIEISQIELNNNVNLSTDIIFDILKIDNYCCRKIMLTNVEFKSIYYK